MFLSLFGTKYHKRSQLGVEKGSTDITILEWVAYPFSSGSPDPGIKPGSPALQADSLPAELPGKPTWNSYIMLNSK